MGRPDSRHTLHRTRRDGWTSARQIGFLDALASTRSVSAAAASVGMRRESAYRLRARDSAGLFSALWDRSLCPAIRPFREGHARRLNDGSLTRLLGTHYRRKRGDYAAIGMKRGDDGKNHRT